MTGNSKSIENSVETTLDDFGIKKSMTTYKYVLWLGTKKGENFLKSIESPNHNFGDYWTMHEAKSQIITKYAKFSKK